MVTFRPLDSRIAAREAADKPFPNEETTPPVTNTSDAMPEPFCSLINEKFWKDIVREAQTHAKPLNEFSEKIQTEAQNLNGNLIAGTSPNNYRFGAPFRYNSLFGSIRI
jgi:hypothetical protein